MNKSNQLLKLLEYTDAKDPHKIVGKTFIDKSKFPPKKIKVIEYDEYPIGTLGYWVEINGEEQQDFIREKTLLKKIGKK